MSSFSVGSTIAGKYRLHALLGEGGMGRVYRAQHLLMDKAVALKLLLPESSARTDARERFLREARAAARVHHPNVVAVYDIDLDGDALYMVMELLEGESFDDLLRRGEVS